MISMSAPPLPAASAAGGLPDIETLRKKIKEMFDMFDKDGKGTIVEECVHTHPSSAVSLLCVVRTVLHALLSLCVSICSP